MYRNPLKLPLISACILGFTLSVQASPIIPGASENLRWGGKESANIQVIAEAQNKSINANTVLVDYLLNSNLFVGDRFTGVTHSKSGLYLNSGIYSSYLLHFDTPGVSKGSVKNQRFNFNGNIVAIILGGEYLKKSDTLLGNSGTVYEQSISRRMEKHDLFTLESEQSLLINSMSIGKYWIDEARIITRNVSEPSSWALFGMGILGLLGARKLSQK